MYGSSAKKTLWQNFLSKLKGRKVHQQATHKTFNNSSDDSLGDATTLHSEYVDAKKTATTPGTSSTTQPPKPSTNRPDLSSGKKENKRHDRSYGITERHSAVRKMSDDELFEEIEELVAFLRGNKKKFTSWKLPEDMSVPEIYQDIELQARKDRLWSLRREAVERKHNALSRGRG